MNIINAQVEILKNAYKGKYKLVYGEFDDKVIIGDVVHFYILKAKDCCIKPHEGLPNDVAILDKKFIKKWLDKPKSEVKLTNESVKHDKNTLVVFQGDNFKVYVNEKLIKCFDLKNSEFRCEGIKSPVYIYEDEAQMGLVFPTNVKF